MSGYTVTITGATGTTGGHVLGEALRRGWNVRAASRRPPARGGWARFDWDDRRTWARAFRGSDAAYVLIPCGFPAGYAQFLAGALSDIASGHLMIPVAPTVQRICGRPAYSARVRRQLRRASPAGQLTQGGHIRPLMIPPRAAGKIRASRAGEAMRAVHRG